MIGFARRRVGVLAGLSMILLGLLLETAQAAAPGRARELRDALANGAGVCCGVLLGLPARKLASLLRLVGPY